LLEAPYVYCDRPALPVLVPVKSDFVTHSRILIAGEMRVLNVEKDAVREVGHGSNKAEPAVYIETQNFAPVLAHVNPPVVAWNWELAGSIVIDGWKMNGIGCKPAAGMHINSVRVPRSSRKKRIWAVIMSSFNFSDGQLTETT
jgi:hypothetical protein